MYFCSKWFLPWACASVMTISVYICDIILTGADTGFLKGGTSWYLGVAESMGHLPNDAAIWELEHWNNRNPRNATSKQQLCCGTFAFILYIIFIFIYFSNSCFSSHPVNTPPLPYKKKICPDSIQIIMSETSLHSKRFRGVGEQRKSEKWDFQCFARVKNGARAKKRKEGARTPLLCFFGSRSIFCAGKTPKNPVPCSFFASKPHGNAC